MSPVTFRKFSFAAGFAAVLLAHALPAHAQGILRDTETEEMFKSYEAPLARAAGLDSVYNRCVKIEHARLFGGLNWVGVNTGVISARRPH